MARILIVESDPQMSGMIAKMLGGKGYRARVETNGAMALLAAHEDVPDVILMDMKTPILEAREMIQALRHNARTSHIPVIVISTRNDDQVMAEALAAGANGFLTRPPDPAELTSLVERLVTLQPKDPART